ncbi:glutamate racemase [Ideonella sp. DXS22W]|uniref:Glutamate racemase n=1 Tax=Pseudaquabacterium inlustre TaxID=2984192 RepID=A0ABU9CIH3_9BURK
MAGHGTSSGNTAHGDAALGTPHIGVFDTGIGGLSVLRALRRQLPAARCTYLADSRFNPWGERPADWVVARSLQLAAWLIERKQVDLVLMACNTATTQAIAALRARWPERPFVGVEPGIKPAVAATRCGQVAVMATPGTLASPRVANLIEQHAGGAQVHRVPCPGLADAIETEPPESPRLAALLDRFAAELQATGSDTVALGCTHYPLVADGLAARLPAGVQLIDTAEAVSRRVASLLPVAARAPGADGTPGALRLLATGDPALLQQAARRWVQPDAQAEALALPDLPG